MWQPEKNLFCKFRFRPRRKMITTVSGQFRSRLKGQGQEFHSLRPYEFGDEAKKIDWKHYAKTDELAVREDVAERNMRIWIAQDISRSMEFGSKPTLVDGFFSFAKYLTNDGGNSVGIMTVSNKLHFLRKPKAGVQTRCAPTPQVDTGELSLSCVSKLFSEYTRSEDIVFLISDFFSTENLEQHIRPFSLNQELIPVVIRDPREKMPVSNARISFRDMETGHYLEVLGKTGLESYDISLKETFNRLFLDFLWIEGKDYNEAIQAILEWLYQRSR